MKLQKKPNQNTKDGIFSTAAVTKWKFFCYERLLKQKLKILTISLEKTYLNAKKKLKSISCLLPTCNSKAGYDLQKISTELTNYIFTLVIQPFYSIAAAQPTYLWKEWGRNRKMKQVEKRNRQKCATFFSNLLLALKLLSSHSREGGRQLSGCDFLVRCKYIHTAKHTRCKQWSIRYAIKLRLLANLHVPILGIFMMQGSTM